MKKVMLINLLFCSSLGLLFGQSGYEEAMKKGFELWRNQQTQEASGVFERIAQAEKDKWIPVYYAANVLISTSFSVDSTELRHAMLEKAKKSIAMAHERSSENAEILTLEGLLYTSYVAMDPMVYGMKYSEKIMNLHAKAVEINPENPRANANMIEYEMGSAKFFGQDLNPYCERMKAVIPLFEKQDTTQFAPSYGIDRAKEIANSCQ